MNSDDFYIGQIFYQIYPPAAALWCNHNNAQIVEKTNESGRFYEIVEKPEPAAPTHEDVRQMRAFAYQQEKDPITCHIQSLKDEEQTEEVIAEIEALMAERAEVVAEIKARYPYPEDIVE